MNRGKPGRKPTTRRAPKGGPAPKRKAATRPSPIKPKAIRTGRGGKSSGGLYPADDLRRVRRLVESAVQIAESLRRRCHAKKLMATAPIALGGTDFTSYADASDSVVRALEGAAAQVSALLVAAERDQDADRL